MERWEGVGLLWGGISCTNHVVQYCAQYWALDVVVDPQQPRYSGPRQLEHPGVAAAGAEQAKITHYASPWARHDEVVLDPLPLKLWRQWGNGSKSFFVTVPRTGGTACELARMT